MANPVSEAVQTVLAVREYQDKEIADGAIRRIAEAGHLTASSVNLQPWHFVVVRERANLRKLGSLIRTGRYITSAAAAVIVAYEKKSDYGLSDASRAIQSMILTAWGEGIGSNWTGFGGMDAVRKEFGLPESYEVLAVVPFGFPRHRVIGRKKRKEFNEVVSAERYGSPLRPSRPDKTGGDG